MKRTGKHLRQSRPHSGHRNCFFKVLSWILLFAITAPLYAAYVTVSAENDVCTHHLEHTEECGYTPPFEGIPCGHVHDETCGYILQDETDGCTHEHDESCGYAEAEGETSCTHEHDENCGYTVPEETGVCTHEHDENCGYTEASDGTPCNFVCEICNEETADLKNTDLVMTDTDAADTALIVVSWSWDSEYLMQDEQTGLWGLGMPGTTEENKMTPELLAEYLPLAINAKMSDGSEQTVEIVWDFGGLPKDGAYEGSYTLTAGMTEAYVFDESAPALEVLLELGGGTAYDNKPKFLNKWYFISLNGSEMTSNEFTASVEGLNAKSREEIIQWLTDTVLPEQIGGWVPNDSVTDPRLPVLGFVQDTGKTDPFYETGVDGDKPYSSAAQWGRVNIDGWRNFPPSFEYDVPFTVQAYTTSKTNGGHTYQLFVNSNNPDDYKTAPTGSDTRTNPDILNFQVTIRDMDLGSHTVTPANPENVRVNLFDYWVTTEKPTVDTDGDILEKSDWHIRPNADEHGFLTSGDTNTSFSTVQDWNKGINMGHLLLFGDGMIHSGLWNKGAGESTQYGNRYAGMEGIVEKTLTDGYPQINTSAANSQLQEGPAERDYQLVRDYQLTGDHTGSPGTSDNGAKYESENIKNLSDSVIRLWESRTNQTIENGKESLQYLFDPDYDHDCKSSYTDVTGLFQLDDQGYYYYNMRRNFAEFSQEGGRNHFILYDAPATLRTDGDQSVGNFFPFNKGSEVYNGMDDNGGLTSTVDCARNTMNHHLGMTVDVDFRQPANGMIGSGGNSKPMSFQFSGDDDVWIFIDDVLVLDLGGIHSEIYGTIDFSSGDVYIGRAFNSKGIPDDPSDPSNLVTHTTLLDAYKEVGKEDTTKWNNNTFASNTSHTLKMFYLERGNYDSSIALRFNLQPLLYQRIEKVDQNGNPIPGIQFTLHPANLADAGAPNAIQCLYTDSDVQNKETFYVQPDESQTLVSLTTDSDGSAVFRTADGEYFNFADRGDQYYVLKETQGPSGYRRQPIDIVLYYDTKISMLSVANRWTTGSYACSVSNVTGSGRLTYGEIRDGTVQDTITPVETAAQRDGLVLAVPALKKQSGQFWMALYGSNLSGFRSVAIDGDGETHWRDAVLLAALRQAEDANTADWHLNWDSGNNRLYGTLDDLPGLASRYLLNNPDGDMDMIYGIISPKALADLGIRESDTSARYHALRQYIQNHTAEDTLRMIQDADNGNGFRFINEDQFTDTFRSLIYIPNERRELRVMKIDQDGRKLSDTQFTLFSDPDCTSSVASGVTDQDGTLIFSPTGNSSIPGQAQMVWANSTNTHYYLKETMAPDGHIRNDTVIPVIVGIYGIYADAGTPEDGVSVMAGVGRLTQTMRQYAMGGDVDITLQDITAFMQIQRSGEFSLTGWEDATLEGTDIVRSMNLHYGKNQVIDYGLHDEDGGGIYAPFFVADTGFVRTRVQQNYEALVDQKYAGSSTDANKENLGDTDLTNLFSLLNMIVVTDRTSQDTGTGQLTVSKLLGGSDFETDDYTKYFTFTIRLTGADGTELTGDYYFYGTDKAGYISSGRELLLHHDESITLLGLPAGTRFTVTETKEQDWYVFPKSGTISGEIIQESPSFGSFYNSREPWPDIGFLILNKSVAGSGDRNRNFTFTVTLTDADGRELEENFRYTGHKEGMISSGQSITLHHDQHITIFDLPAGTQYTVTEQEADQDGYTTSAQGESGIISDGETHTAAFLNTMESELPDDPESPGNPADSDTSDEDSSSRRNAGGNPSSDSGTNAASESQIESLQAPGTGDTTVLAEFLLLLALSGPGAAALIRKKKHSI